MILIYAVEHLSKINLEVMHQYDLSADIK